MSYFTKLNTQQRKREMITEGLLDELSIPANQFSCIKHTFAFKHFYLGKLNEMMQICPMSCCSIKLISSLLHIGFVFFSLFFKKKLEK
jgi:hypothetical protein